MADKLSNRSRSWYLVPLIALLFGTLSVSILLFSNKLHLGLHENAKLIDEVNEMQIDIAVAHLWFEEYISGDASIDINAVQTRLDRAKMVVESLISGGHSGHGMVVKPLTDKEALLQAQKIKAAIAELAKAANQRKELGDLAGIGTLLDERFDKIFKEILGLASSFEDLIDKETAKSNDRYENLFWAMLLAWAAVLTGGTFIIANLERKRHMADSGQELFRFALDNSEDGIFLIDRKDMRFVDVNKATCDNLGFTRDELLSLGPQDVMTSHTMKALQDVFDSVITDVEGSGVLAGLFQRRDESRFPVEVVMKGVTDPRGRDIIVATSRDTTDRRVLEDRLRREATTDSLTGAYNRLKFKEIIEVEMERAARYGQPLTVSMLDLDLFKKVNDTHGHATGDRVLKEITDIIRSSIRKVDYLVRWGGEEFIIIAPGTDKEGGITLFERVRKTVESHEFKTVGRQTVSFGQAQFRVGDKMEDLIHRTDIALYRAKEMGRNRVEVEG